MQMPNNLRVWGVSRYRDLLQCPRYFVAKYEWKRWIDDDENEAMKRGSRCHKTIEEAIKYNMVLPDEPMFNAVADYVYALTDMKAQGIGVFPEHKFGLDIDFNQVDFFRAPNLRARIGLDVYVNNNGRALVADWKTGRYKPDHIGDADFYGAATFMAVKPRSLEVQYIYADDPQCSFTRVIEDAETMMNDFWNKFDEADHYLATRLQEPPMNPSKVCGYCGDVTCPHNKNDKAKATAAAQQANSSLLFRG